MARKRVSRKKREKNERVSSKVKALRDEGVPEKQAVAESMSMERSGRLRRGGKYIHKRRGRRKE